MTRLSGDLARSMVSTPYDPLAQFGPTQHAPVDVRGGARTFGACILLATGVGGAVWLAVLVHAVVFRPQTVGLLDRLAPADVEALTLTLPAGKFQLPAAVLSVVGYLVLIALASIVAKLATAMLKHGVTLLSREAATPESAQDSETEPSPSDSLP